MQARCSATGVERVDAVPGGYYVRPALVEMKQQDGAVFRRPSRRSFTSFATASSTRRSRCTMRCRRACPRRSSPPTCARPSCSSPRRAPIAASPTSISARRAPRSAARSAARRRPAAAAKAAPTAGAPTCGARPTRSITAGPAARSGHPLRRRPIAPASPRRARPASAAELLDPALQAPGSIGAEIRYP